MLIDKEILDKIKQAINVEVEHSYIDIRGKKMTFSKFIILQLQEIYKQNKNNQILKFQIDNFNHYAMASLSDRRLIIRSLINTIKNFLNENKKNENIDVKKDNQLQDYESLDVQYLKGVGPKISFLFNKLNIFKVPDLLSFYPKKYMNYEHKCLIRDLKLDEYVTIFAKIDSLSSFTVKNSLTIIKTKISDNSGSIYLNQFFAKSNKFLIAKYKKQFYKGQKVLVSGKVKLDNYSSELTLDKPQIEIISDSFSNSDLEDYNKIVPVYPLVENLNLNTLRKSIKTALTLFKSQIKNILPEYLIEKYNLLDRYQALEIIHFPTSTEKLDLARKTLIFEELFLLQLKFANLKKQTQSLNSFKFEIKENGLVNKFINNLPFKLTNGQKKAVDEILKDIEREKPMQRMLQGDVGAGKTVVAIIAILAAIENGTQAAFMAPTEILAQQHFNNLVKWLFPLGINVGLFIGSNTQKLKNKLHKDLLNGQINIAVGTHALIQNNIEFNNLGLVVIDEQHRFGVEQRSKLQKKGKYPKLLSMSATPIPRSLALSVHGDLDLTIINELPKGRKSIKTSLISSNLRLQAYNLIRRELEKNNQAYIIYPLIEESENLTAKAASSEALNLQQGEFANYKVGLLHGKLSNQEKDDVMNDFKNKKYDILVATTVVEVGVDIKDATVIIIENAERFGLTQLHQLRGRVGRSDKQSYCVLISSTSNEDTKKRLEIMTQTNDGFIIAQKDLEIRGPGEFLGTKQSGINELSLADITRDLKILEIAKKEAFDFVDNYDLNNYPTIKKKLNEKEDINKNFSFQAG